MKSKVRPETSQEAPAPASAPVARRASFMAGGVSLSRVAASKAHVFATPILLVLFLIVFSALRPSDFATWSNLSSLISGQSVIGCLALAAILPLAIGEFDLSFGYSVGFVGMVGAKLAGGGSDQLVVLVAMLVVGCLVGVINGFLTVSLNISSFIGTLGVGIILSGLTEGISGGQTLFAGIPKLVTDLGQDQFLSVTIAAWMVIALAVVLYYLLQHTRSGRYLFAIGGSNRVARLAGIHTDFYRILAFTLSGLLTAIAAIFALGENGSANPSFGPDLLLPAYAAVFLGVTSFRPGRYNVAGTIVALMVLAVGVSGIELLGAPLWIQPVFNGSALLIAVTIARNEARRVQVGA
jgi:ribose transport system permease protein